MSDNIVNFGDAKQRADWEDKERKAKALKKQFQRAMSWKSSAPKTSSTRRGKRGPGGKKKR